MTPVSPFPAEPPDSATIRALRQDVALQITRHIQRSGHSQTAAARALDVPQPTLSKIVHGRVADLSLELLIRIAVRARLPLVLHTGKDPAEAGAAVGAVGTSGRAQRSRLTEQARATLSASAHRLTPEQRLQSQLRHSELLAELHRGSGLSAAGGRVARRRTRSEAT